MLTRVRAAVMARAARRLVRAALTGRSVLARALHALTAITPGAVPAFVPAS